MKLHLGCGNVHLPHFVNIDQRETPATDRIEDIGALPSLRPATVDLIYCCHALDHFTRWDYMDVLKRWREVLKAGGIVRLSVVDFSAVVSLYLEGTPVSDLIGLLHARQDYPSNVRKMSWDYASLKSDLLSAGFHDVQRWYWRETDHADIDDCSQAYWPRGDKSGRLMSLNVEAVA